MPEGKRVIATVCCCFDRNENHKEKQMTMYKLLNGAALVVLSILSLSGFVHAQQVDSKGSRSSSVEAVWGREQLYWRLVKSGDVEKYRELWDGGFRGWPCNNQHTADKSEIGNWVRDIRDQKAKITYSLTFEGAAEFGDIVVVYYQTQKVYEYPDGRIVDKDKHFKFTHTWRKTGNTWLIIGGMCGELPPAPKP